MDKFASFFSFHFSEKLLNFLTPVLLINTKKYENLRKSNFSSSFGYFLGYHRRLLTTQGTKELGPQKFFWNFFKGFLGGLKKSWSYLLSRSKVIKLFRTEQFFLWHPYYYMLQYYSRYLVYHASIYHIT